ncbi:carboxymuconolactone decarboxylase family protein [Streptomyces sp. NPDC048282]|uniref:carboxymuconolactone decarboxylase family protein n=1 Tax=Streptomyces sp. NPDC048282 TaxID=3365528 RepID=UPI003722465F
MSTTEEAATVNERQAAGMRVVEAMLGKEFMAANMGAAPQGEGPVPSMGRLALEHVFGDIWGRPGLDRRSRSLITLGVLMAQGHQTEIGNHVRAGQANGLTPDEILEAVLHTAPYIGYPAAGQAMATAVRELGQA